MKAKAFEILIIFLLIFAVGCKEQKPKKKIFLWTQTVQYKNGEKQPTDAWRWKEFEILERKGGLWKVSKVKGQHFKMWIDPNNALYREIESQIQGGDEK